MSRRLVALVALPALIVLALSFLAIKLISQDSPHHPRRRHSYQRLVSTELPDGEVESIEFENGGRDLLVEVAYKDKEAAEFYVPRRDAPELVKRLRSAGVAYSVAE